MYVYSSAYTLKHTPTHKIYRRTRTIIHTHNIIHTHTDTRTILLRERENERENERERERGKERKREREKERERERDYLTGKGIAMHLSQFKPSAHFVAPVYGCMCACTYRCMIIDV